MDRTCKVEDCGKPHCARGYCNSHYANLRRTGNPVTPSRREIDRFWRFVDRGEDDECWPWKGGLAGGGYGTFRYRKSDGTTGKVAAHRFAYEVMVGPIPQGLEVDHVRSKGCKLRSCVNAVSHLEPVTQIENLRRADGVGSLNSRKTHCINGHEFTAENTRLARGWRQCRTCERGRKRTARELGKRAAA